MKRKLVRKITAGEQFKKRVKRKFSSIKLPRHFCYTFAAMKILAIVAGTNDPSNSDTLASAFLEGAKTVDGVETEKLKLKDFPLPQFTLDCYDDNCPVNPEFAKLKAMVLSADAIVIATPIWNFGIPGHLKNFIDWMGCFALDSETKSRGTLNGKPFYFIFTGGAPLAAWKGLMRFTTLFLPEGLRFFGATIVGKYFEGKCTVGKGKFGLVVDKRPDSLAAVSARGKRFALFALNFKNTGVLPLGKRITEKAYYIGKRIMAKL